MSQTAKAIPRCRIGVLELAERLVCHPMSISRLVKQKRLPLPHKILNKNFWFEEEIDALIERGLPPPILRERMQRRRRSV
jgi:hypothetical protein